MKIQLIAVFGIVYVFVFFQWYEAGVVCMHADLSFSTAINLCIGFSLEESDRSI